MNYTNMNKITVFMLSKANQLASEILMPNTLIDKYLENGVNTYKELADRLEVSESALRKRLKNLHNEYLL